MKKVIIEFDECIHTGMPGLFLQGTDREIVHGANDGVLIAHDIVEHNGVDTIGGICDELEAFGALWYVRGALDDMYRNSKSIYSSYDLVEMEISMLSRKVIENVGLDSVIPTTTTCIYDQDFAEIIDNARRRTLNSVDVDEVELEVVKHYFDHCIHFLRSGYRKAKRRYKRMDQLRVNSLFWNIVEEVNTYLPFMEYEGQQIELRYCLSSGYALGNLIEPH